MSTDSNSPTSSTTNGNHNADHALEDFDGGFTFNFSQADEAKHKVEVDWERHYTDEIRVTSSGVVERRDEDGFCGADSRIQCSCGKQFDNRKEAKDHLATYQRRFLDVPPLPELRNSSVQREDTVFNGLVEGKIISGNHICVVTDGHDYLVATARESFQPPENYAFDGWDPISSSGRMRYQAENRTGPMFRVQYLREAMQWVTGHRANYDPDRYTIYFRGNEPLYIEGAGNGVILAPVVPATQDE